MLYCSKCKRLTDDTSIIPSRCEHCGSRKLTPTTEDSPVFLTSKNALWAGMVEDVLKDHNIPCIRKIEIGDGITESILGYGIEKYSFYVPFSYLETAHDVVFPLFTPVEDCESLDEVEE